MVYKHRLLGLIDHIETSLKDILCAKCSNSKKSLYQMPDTKILRDPCIK